MSGSDPREPRSPVGSAVIGKSDPAKNHGTIAMAGTAAMYSSCSATRLAMVSATPYMPIARSDAPATNHSALPAS